MGRAFLLALILSPALAGPLALLREDPGRAYALAREGRDREAVLVRAFFQSAPAPDQLG
ncbi:MAG: hypothetical protein RMI36_10595 [Thermus sp.]|uniref:hypothetical protein n=1 Tax=Thermus sp. TaxID=275 RepID=UPI00298F1AF4|nr:hypothetical protein [Thermus sp.]MDW8018259.1 hypothetical protein [Thermus sp.]